ncbi:hypothetical protein ACWEVD_30215 [Nocardia thailandica]|uniref:Lipoprotein lpqE n=1 Tax=Nocardia thailandica TaxID=257275 RepID=A0ABW6PHE7_9NOCA
MTALKAVTAPSARRRMVTVAALAAAGAVALSGCGAGQHTQTSSQVAAINGNNADIGQIALRDVQIVLPPAGSADYALTKGGKAVIALSIINDGEIVTDELTSVTTDLGQVKITAPGGDPAFKIAPQQTVVAGKPATSAATGGTDDHHGTPAPSAAPDKPATDPEAKPGSIEIQGLVKDIVPGLTYTVTFNFKDAGTIQVQVPVDAGPDTVRVVNEKSGPAPEGAGH